MKKKSVILCLLFLAATKCFSQAGKPTLPGKYEINQLSDTYVGEIAVDSALFKKKGYCAFPQKGKYTLYSGKIKNVFFIPEKKTVFDRYGLQNVTFFVIRNDIKLDSHKAYIVTLCPGSSKRYLIVNRILEIKNPMDYQFVNNNLYLSGFVTCYKIGIFNKILELVGLKSPEQINYENKKIKKDPFDEFIEERKKID